MVTEKMQPRASDIPWSDRRAAAGSRAFTLVELIVSVALLVGLLAMVGVAFNSVTDASGIAIGASAVSRDIRAVMDQMRLDFEGIIRLNEPKQRFVIEPQVESVGYTRNDSQGRSCYADRVAFITQRAGSRTFAYLEGDPARPASPGSWYVSYGHASLTNATGSTAFGPDDSSPAANWHLARMAVGLMDGVGESSLNDKIRRAESDVLDYPSIGSFPSSPPRPQVKAFQADASNVGQFAYYCLPGCVSFRVVPGYRKIVDPNDGVVAAQFKPVSDRQTDETDPATYDSLSNEWTGIPHYVMIEIKVIDRNQAMEEPVTHTMVVRCGEF